MAEVRFSQSDMALLIPIQYKGSPYQGLPFQVTAGRWMDRGLLGYVVNVFIFKGVFGSSWWDSIVGAPGARVLFQRQGSTTTPALLLLEEDLNERQVC